MKYPLPESTTLEFKKELPKNNQIIKTVIGFCNHKGGKLIIGVDDDGTIVGIPQEQISQTLEYLDYSIYKAATPQIIPSIYLQNVGGKMLLIIEVSAGLCKPYYLKSEGLEKGTYIRIGRSTVQAKPETIRELQLQSGGRSYDKTPVYNATVADLNSEKIVTFLKTRKYPSEVVELQEALKAYELVTEEHGHQYPTVAGMLLFGNNPQKFFPQMIVNCAHFKGIAGRDIISYLKCEGTLFEQFNKGLSFFHRELTKSLHIEDAIRIEELEIPSVALRELLINAIVHRNYYVPGSIKVSIFDNRVEILSPGEFPGSMSTSNLLMGLSYIRNDAILKVFVDAGYCETLGTGFRIAFESLAKKGLLAPQIIEGENFVKCTIARPLSHTITSNADREGETERMLALFNVSKDLSMKDITESLQITRTTALRRLNDLIKNKLIIKTGTGKATRYSLA